MSPQTRYDLLRLAESYNLIHPLVHAGYISLTVSAQLLIYETLRHERQQGRSMKVAVANVGQQWGMSRSAIYYIKKNMETKL